MRRLIFVLLPALVLFLAFRPVNSHTVSGKVTDDAGKPIVASVMVKGTKIGTVTANDGSYKIVVPNENDVLVFSAVSYITQEIKISGMKVVNAILSASNARMEEVVMKRQDTNFYQKLAGKAPGISVGATSYPYDNTGVYHDNSEYYNTEEYDHITENRFLKATINPLSTFSIDVDAASYSNVRRFLNMGQLPPAGAVRIEEMINYFNYNYEGPKDHHPFSIHTEISDAPWNSKHKLVLIGLQGKKIATENLPPSNLVFLVDVSGSMNHPMKLPLVKQSMKMLVDQLRDEDRVAMVVYAGAAGLVLPSTSGSEKKKIKAAIDNLDAGGSTAGGEGIRLAYKVAKKNFVDEGNNRVILCTDGDFNVGASSDDEMERLIEEERKSGVFLTVLGYGMGNYKDSKMQKLADKGNGNHAYIDGISEAKKVLVNEFGGTLFTIAKDVKLQVEFNPAKVQGYRLIGYENRMLNKEDFNNDKKDAGELGSGHTVTALYEVIPVGVKTDLLEKVDGLKYQDNKIDMSKAKNSPEIMTIKFRYKSPDEDVSKLIEHPVLDTQTALAKTSDNFRFAAAVAEFGMILRNSEFKSSASISNVIAMARRAKGEDLEGYRAEFIKMVLNAQSIAGLEPDEDDDVSYNEK